MFYNYISEKRSRGKIYQGCDSSMEIAQNSHDVTVLLAIRNYFNEGYIKPKYDFYNIYECKNSSSVNRFIYRNTNSIINFVDKYPMLTRKHLDYLD
jgi:LAGLIDADG endonuclease